MRAAIYARFSSTMQREASIEDQARLCLERADREGWSVVQTFSDMAISGASMHRPGLQSLIAEVERGGIDVILAEALDRLSRDQADIATLFKQLSFHGVALVTLAEGEINELHVGLKGTMNQLFLKDLAAKTRRGLRGRVEAGHSGGGNSYGYEVVRRLGDDGVPVTGERRILEDEARVIRRVFTSFADGQSALAIARALNDEGIPGPRGKLWRDTSIRGHRRRGTGLLNNELYIGRLVWNRLRYLKDPSTGKRVSRLNPDSEWITRAVPELRIVEDALWDRVKARQNEIDQTPAVQGIKRSRFWERRRSTHLLTGLLFCDCCGGPFATVGKDYLACSNARKLKSCSANRSFKRGHLERAVLDLLKDRLMEPDAVAAFISAFTSEANAQRGAADNQRKQLQKDLDQTARKLSGLYDAIADGLRTAGLLAQIQELEARKDSLTSQLADPAPSPVRLHPNLAELYRRKVTDLANSLADETIRSRALELLGSLIERVIVHAKENGDVVLILEGAITGMIDAAQPGGLRNVDVGSVKVVAGVGFEPTTFRL
ncbi:recombinase family protein [Litorisediminicola beolgyonensis]|uniref:Recombinase family protein n=1 Tax=Litorisediminicola beolgyonensis TaxID=1173614 RepID=A0ABW3ZN28_9RHOB